MLNDILPVWRVIKSAQVGLKLAAENLERSTLADTVRSDQTQHIPGSGHRQTMELEAVGRITMGDLTLEVRRQVDDSDSAEGAAFGADTTTDAEGFGDEGNS